MQIQPNPSDGLTQIERSLLTCNPDDLSSLAHRLVSHLDLLLEIWKAILDKLHTYYEDHKSNEEKCEPQEKRDKKVKKIERVEKNSYSEAV